MGRFYSKFLITIFFQSAILLSLCIRSYASDDSVIRIKLSGVIYSDETIVRLMETSTTDFDFDFDAYKIMSGGVTPSIYTSINNTTYSINSIPSFDSLPVVQLRTKILEDGIYVISFECTSESNSTIKPYSLVDKKLGVEIVIDSGVVYSYTGSVADASDRFELHFKKESNNKVSTSVSKAFGTEHRAFVSSCPGGMFVSLTNVSEKQYTIEMVRAGGRILETMVKEINTPAYGEFIELTNLPMGSYVVKLTIGDAVATFHVNILQ